MFYFSRVLKQIQDDFKMMTKSVVSLPQVLQDCGLPVDEIHRLRSLKERGGHWVRCSPVSVLFDGCFACKCVIT